MKAIKIDVLNRTVETIQLDGGLEAKQKVVGGLIEEATALPNGDVVYVNEEGLINGTTDFFIIEGAHQPFAGNGLVVGFDESAGESRDCKSNERAIREKVTFADASTILVLIKSMEENKRGA